MPFILKFVYNNDPVLWLYVFTTNRNQEKLIDDLMFGEEDAEQILEQHKEQVKETKKTLFSHAGIIFLLYFLIDS